MNPPHPLWGPVVTEKFWGGIKPAKKWSLQGSTFVLVCFHALIYILSIILLIMQFSLQSYDHCDQSLIFVWSPRFFVLKATMTSISYNIQSILPFNTTLISTSSRLLSPPPAFLKKRPSECDLIKDEDHNQQLKGNVVLEKRCRKSNESEKATNVNKNRGICFERGKSI